MAENKARHTEPLYCPRAKVKLLSTGTAGPVSLPGLLKVRKKVEVDGSSATFGEPMVAQANSASGKNADLLQRLV